MSGMLATVRCQSHAGTKRPFVPQPRNIDVFLPLPVSHHPCLACLTACSTITFLFRTKATLPAAVLRYILSATGSDL